MVHFGSKTGSHRVGCAQVVAPQGVTRVDGRFEFPGQIAVLSVSRLLTRLRAPDRTSPGPRRQRFWLQTSLSPAAQHPPPTAFRLPPAAFRPPIAVLTCGPARGIVWVWGGWRALPGREPAPRGEARATHWWARIFLRRWRVPGGRCCGLARRRESGGGWRRSWRRGSRWGRSGGFGGWKPRIIGGCIPGGPAARRRRRPVLQRIGNRPRIPRPRIPPRRHTNG